MAKPMLVNKPKESGKTLKLGEDASRQKRAETFKAKLFALMEEYQCDIVGIPELVPMASGAWVTAARWSIRPK